MDPRALTRTAYDAAAGHFADYLRYSDAHDPIYEKDQWFQWSDLEMLVSKVPGAHRGIAIYYGLDEDALRFGIRVLRLLPGPDPGEYDYDPVLDKSPGDRPTHLLMNNAFSPVAPADWDALAQAYFGEVKVDREGDGHFAALNPLQDPKAIVLPWEDEVLRLWNDNQGPIAGSEARVLLSSIALYHDGDDHAGPDGYRHGAGFIVQTLDPQGKWTNLLDDVDHAPKDFQQKVGDYGSMCPSNCKRYR